MPSPPSIRRANADRSLPASAAEVAAADNAEKSDTLRQGMKASLAQLNRHMLSFGERLAPYQFLIVFPQLISRICHAHPDVFSQLKVGFH